jgi:tetratricopeptide (TPR) repeat protein
MKKKQPFPLFLSVILFGVLAALLAQPLPVSAAGKSPEKSPEKLNETQPADVEKQQNIEEILGALNDALLENRKLRENMGIIQEAVARMTVDSSVLQSRIRTLEKEAEQSKNAVAQSATSHEEQGAAISQLSSEKENLYAELLKREAEIKELEKGNEQLQEVLDHTILEEERQEYDRLMQETSAKVGDMVEKLSGVKRENEKIKEELTDLYYLMGNAMFENKNYEGAIKEYKKTLEWNPSHSYAHHNLAVIYDYYLDNHPRAAFHYEKYLALKPLDEAAHHIRERVIEIGLIRNAVPAYPLRLDYNEHHQKKELPHLGET